MQEKVLKMKNVENLPFASYLHLPQDPDFVVSTYTPKGTAFCCATEAMLCGLENPEIRLKGKINREAVQVITDLAQKNGLFERTGKLKSFKTDTSK